MKLVKRIFWFFIIVFGILFAAYVTGPRIKYKDIDNEPLAGTYTLPEVSEILRQRNKDTNIKPNNGERIVWADGQNKTEYAFVYLHGFSASHEEGAPLHQNIANRYGGNLYLTRLPRHGLTGTEAFEDLTPLMMVEYAKEAIKIGKSIGEKVIVLSCSTGSTLSAYLAAADPDIHAQIMFSPNFEMQNKTTKWLPRPWGLMIARQIKGSDYHEWNTPQMARPYWYHKYRLEGVAALQSLINSTMNEKTYESITQPIFVGYYYKDEQTRDFTVSTEKIMEVEPKLGTPDHLKTFKQYPDGKAHVFISPLFNDNWEKVQSDVYDFLEQKLEMHPSPKKVVVTE